MTPDGPQPPHAGGLSPDEVAGREFRAARKGYDRAEVRAFLASAAETIRVATERISDLERRLARAAVESGDAPAGVEDGLLEAVSAEAWRDDVLADLDRRRRELNAEVVRLRAGRDRLRADLDEVADDIAEHVRRLDGSLQAARAAGDLEERRARSGPALSVEERRAELEAARLAGFVTVGSPPAEAGAPQPPPGDGNSEGAPPVGQQEARHDTGDGLDAPVADPGVPAGGAPQDREAELEAPSPGEGDAGDVGVLFARLRAERSGGRSTGRKVGAAGKPGRRQ